LGGSSSASEGPLSSTSCGGLGLNHECPSKENEKNEKPEEKKTKKKKKKKKKTDLGVGGVFCAMQVYLQEEVLT
jgi:hypothetical protein